MTVECWFKTDDTNNQKSSSSLVSRYNGSGDQQFLLSMGSAGALGFATSNTSGLWLQSYTTTTYKDANWHHVAGTYNSATGVSSIYVDGALINTATNSIYGLLSNNTTVRLIIGNDHSGTSPNTFTDRQFRGAISDVRIWNVVRSAADISNNYRQRLVGNETGLVGYWKLNQGYGTGWGSYTTALDSTSNRAHGTLVSFASPSSNWTLSNLYFIPTISALVLGSKNGVYTITDASFSFIDPSSNSMGAFTYTIDSSAVTLSNGAATKKTIYGNTGITIPALLTYNFPEIASLSDWQIDISFTVTSGSGTSRALVGDMYNEINAARGWGLYVSPYNRIIWNWLGLRAEPSPMVVGLNTSYVLTASQTAGVISLTLQNPPGLYTSSLSISNIVAFYPFDSSGNDTSTNNNHLTNNGTVTFNTSDYKRGSGAAAFNGSNYFQITNDGRFSPDNFTVAFWIKPVDGGGNYQSIASCRDGYTFKGWMVYINPNNNLEFVTGGSGSGWSYNPDILLNGLGTINTWVHIAFTLSKSTSTVIAYINGVSVATITRTYTNTTTYPLRIGAGGDLSNGELFLRNGTLLDEFRFYNKVLTAAEIRSIVSDSSYSSTLQNSSSSYTSSFSISNNVALYILDSNGNDSSTNNNHLTNNGGVSFDTYDYIRGNGAAAFNGSNHFQITNDGRFSPDNFTIAFWVKPVDGASNYQAIASCRNGTGTLTGWIIYINPNNDLDFWTGGSSSWSSGVLFTKFGLINTWAHVTITFTKATSSLTTYINGSVVAYGTRTYFNNTGTNLRIGAGSNEGAANFFVRTGTLIDEFRFYNKVLTASEISSIVADSYYTSTLTIGTNNTMGKGPVTIGGWRNRVNENFPGTISYVNVSVPTNLRVASFNAGTGATPATVTATQSAFLDSLSGTKTASLTVNKVASTIGAFTIPAKNLLDAPFNLTAPTSNVTDVSFTYISSNTNVATVTTGGTVTIVGLGTTTITATQAETALYMSGSVSASLVVTLNTNQTGVDLSGVNLSNANLTNYNFTDANLTNVNLSSAIFTSANLTNTRIVGANLTGVTFTDSQKIQLRQNADNVAANIAAIALSATISPTSITAVIPSLKPADIANLEVIQVLTPALDASNTLAVTVSPNVVEGFYIGVTADTPVRINGVVYQSTGSGANAQVLDENQTPVIFIRIGAVLYRVYPGSIIGIPVDPDYYKVKSYGLGAILIEAAIGSSSGNVGPTGSTGPVGFAGIDGATGSTGPAGYQGVTGATGEVGATGAQGPTGMTGAWGVTGSYGEIGATGPTGPMGETGPNAGKGDTGATGVRGPTGYTGVYGPQGENGITGNTGATGSVGATGPTGESAAVGYTGATGAVGGATGANIWGRSGGDGGGGNAPIYYNSGRVGIQTSPAAPASTQYLLDVSGNIKTTGVMNVSDYRIKQEIVYIRPATIPVETDRIMLSNQVQQLRPVMFQNRLRNNVWEYGFLAHEVQAIFPELVNGDKDKEGDLQAISYHQLFAICCEEIKTLNARLAALDARHASDPRQ
jgi:uncharacterized protein YjbI with pentapeptide repeats